MPQIMNTNVLSLNVQRNPDHSGGLLATVLQKLSSDLRINSARDDAAGLAIVNRMTSRIRGSNRATRNRSDAISLAQTGEGGLQEITNNLQHMRESAIQSRNATINATDIPNTIGNAGLSYLAFRPVLRRLYAYCWCPPYRGQPCASLPTWK